MFNVAIGTSEHYGREMLFVLCCWRDVTKTLLIKLHMSTQWIHVYYYIYNIPQFLCRRIILFCCIYPPHLKGRSLKILSNIKPARGAKKVEDRWSRDYSFLLLHKRNPIARSRRASVSSHFYKPGSNYHKW